MIMLKQVLVMIFREQVLQTEKISKNYPLGEEEETKWTSEEETSIQQEIR